MEHPKFQYSKILKEIAVLVLTISNGLSQGQDQPPPRVGFDPARIAPRIAPRVIPRVIPRLATEPTERVILDTPPVPDSPPTPPSRAASRPHATQEGEGKGIDLAIRRYITSIPPDPTVRVDIIAHREIRPARLSPLDRDCDSVVYYLAQPIGCGGCWEFLFYLHGSNVVDVVSNSSPNFFRFIEDAYPDSPDWPGPVIRHRLHMRQYRDALGQRSSRSAETSAPTARQW